MKSGLWIILLEAGLALAILIFVVRWTLPKRPKGGERGGAMPGDDNGTPRR